MLCVDARLNAHAAGAHRIQTVAPQTQPVSSPSSTPVSEPIHWTNVREIGDIVEATASKDDFQVGMLGIIIEVHPEPVSDEVLEAGQIFYCVKVCTGEDNNTPIVTGVHHHSVLLRKASAAHADQDQQLLEMLSPEQQTRLKELRAKDPDATSGPNKHTVAAMVEELILREAHGGLDAKKLQKKSRSAIAVMLKDARLNPVVVHDPEDADEGTCADDDEIPYEGRPKQKYQWTHHDWCLLAHVMISPEIAELYGKCQQHLRRDDWERSELLPQDELLKALVTEFNDSSRRYDSRAITKQCADLRGLDANKAQRPCVDPQCDGVCVAGCRCWSGWTGPKLFDKVKAMRPALTVVYNGHSKSGQNNGEDIWNFVELAKEYGSVAPKAIAYWMYVLRDSNSGLLDTLARLLPEAAREDGGGQCGSTPRGRVGRKSPDGIDAALLRELFKPSEEEARNVQSAELGTWLDHLGKLTDLKRKAQEDGNDSRVENIAAKIARIEAHVDAQFDDLLPPSPA